MSKTTYAVISVGLFMAFIGIMFSNMLLVNIGLGLILYRVILE